MKKSRYRIPAASTAGSNAIKSVKTKTVIEWHKNNIGKSVQAKRMSAFRLPKILEQKAHQRLTVGVMVNIHSH